MRQNNSNSIALFKKLGVDFSSAQNAARQLLGCELVFTHPEGICSGYITETEAYTSEDPASHSFKWKTERTAPLFMGPGTVYVYFTYGLHFCVNIVTGLEGDGQAVLIRSLQPVQGVDLMKKRRGTEKISNLTTGPAKLTQAMGIDLSLSGTNITDGPLTIKKGLKPKVVISAKRVGISQAKDKLWRFYIKDNLYISRT